MNNFNVHAVNLVDYWGEAQELELNNTGERARYRIIIGTKGSAYRLVRKGRWQNVKYTAKGESYIMYYFKEGVSNKQYKKRLLLKNFIKVGSPWLPSYHSDAD